VVQSVWTDFMAANASSSFLTSLGSHQVIIIAPNLQSKRSISSAQRVDVEFRGDVSANPMAPTWRPDEPSFRWVMEDVMAGIL
jgi:hypothetical protein